MAHITSKNPATGEILAEIECTPSAALSSIFTNANSAQTQWAAMSTKKRSRYLYQLREIIIHRSEEIIDLISKENGKPKFEALSSDIIPVIYALTHFAKHAPSLLKDKKISLSTSGLFHRKSYLNYWPLGTVLIISPWNFPFHLPFTEIIMALAAGNAVVFKPSEVTPLIGKKIKELCDEAGLPPHLVQCVIGDGSLGAELIQHQPKKIFFTGSPQTGKKIMAAAAEHLIPVNLELGGKNAMLILPDADLDFSTSAALWGAYSNSGQICASIERIIIHDKLVHPFTAMLKEKIKALRLGASDSWENDLGPITLEKQKETYSQQIEEARTAGIEIHTGGKFSDDKRFLPPTLLSGNKTETLSVYLNESFGPIASITTYRSVAEAIQKVNNSPYGLTASIITRDLSFGEDVAKQLEVGTVMINEVVYTAGVPETPWGGLKMSGFGLSHGNIGLFEFVNTRHIHKPVSKLFVFKSPWWFPYTPHQAAMFKNLLRVYRRSFFDKIRAIPDVLWNLVHFIKKEKRL